MGRRLELRLADILEAAADIRAMPTTELPPNASGSSTRIT
jgi:hypothetical protein